MRVALGADHAGFELKQLLATLIKNLGHEACDLGTNSSDSVDYPDFAIAVAHSVAGGEADCLVMTRPSNNCGRYWWSWWTESKNDAITDVDTMYTAPLR